MNYKILAIAAALLVAPSAFAEGPRERGLPPRPHDKEPLERRMPESMMGSTTEGRPMMPPRLVGTSTESRPLFEQERRRQVMSSTSPMAGTSTPREERFEQERREMIGTTTPPKGVARAFMNHMFSFFSKEKQESTTTPPMPQGREVAANNASSTDPVPPRGVQGFFQHFFGWFR